MAAESRTQSLYTRTTRDTHELLTVARPAAIGADTSEGAWVTLCEAHGTLIYSDTRQLAMDSRGMDFCDDCRDEDARARQQLGVLPGRTPEQQAAWARVTGDATTVAEQQQAAIPTTGTEPCTCSLGYNHAANCPNCSANLALRAQGLPHAYAADRLAPAYPGATTERRSFAVCRFCGMTDSRHSARCASRP